jgi:hypothetical protein
VLLWLACAQPAVRPPPVAPRWGEVEALAETGCAAWDDDRFGLELSPAERRAALRAWHAEAPAAAMEIEAQYVRLTWVAGMEVADLAPLAHVVSSLRQCDRAASRAIEEEMLLLGCATDADAARAALATAAPPPTAQVYAAREAVFAYELALESVSGPYERFRMVGFQDFLSRWVLDERGERWPEVPTNLPLKKLLTGEAAVSRPGVPEAVARCLSGAGRTPRPEATGTLDGGVARWPSDGVIGTRGPLGPLDVWDATGRVGRIEAGEPTLVDGVLEVAVDVSALPTAPVPPVRLTAPGSSG